MNTWYIYILLLTVQVVAVTIFVEGIVSDKLRKQQQELQQHIIEEFEECTKSSDS